MARTRTPGAGGLEVMVDLDAIGAQSCTLISYLSDGSFRHSHGVSADLTGTVRLALSVEGLPAHSNQVVLCVLQPGGKIIGIRPQQ